MAKERQSGIKSAYELAMERLEESAGRQKPVSASKKKALAEVDEKTRAAVAELEIMYGQRLAAARASGDPVQLEEVEASLRREVRKLREEGEAEKERIRGGVEEAGEG